MFIQPVGQIADKDYFYILHADDAKEKVDTALSQER
jgi:hypothetical protein